jgi:hypothetical protein
MKAVRLRTTKRNALDAGHAFSYARTALRSAISIAGKLQNAIYARAVKHRHVLMDALTGR